MSAAPGSQAAADGGPGAAGHGRRRRTRTAATIAVLAAVGTIAVVMALQPGSGSAGSTGGGLPPGQSTSTVSRRTLTESSTVEGTLSYGATLELYDRLAGTFTWLPRVGAVIRRGGTLFRVDDRPVALMYGSVPAYRTLKEGFKGPDVAELNRNLIALGFDPYGAIAEEEDFGEATAAAVDRWQEAEGLPVTGEVELGRVLFAPGARRVTVLHVSLGEDPPPASGSEDAHGKGAGTEKPNGENEGSGSNPTAAAPKAVLSTTSTRQLVKLKLSASEQGLARAGERAPVRLPDGSVVEGRITGVGRVAESAAGEGGEGKPGGGEEGHEPTISATLVLDHPVARLDEAPVSVELLKQVRRHVLAVPATALSATAGGGYEVEVIEGGRRRELAVTPGMFADGYVQVDGRGVHAGLRVIEPSE